MSCKASDKLRVKELREEVCRLGRNPKDYRYDLDARRPYRIDGDKVYILINDKKSGLEIQVDKADFYEKFLAEKHWTRLNSNPTKDYPHVNVHNAKGILVNLLAVRLILGDTIGYKVTYLDGNHYNLSRSNLKLIPATSKETSDTKKVKAESSEELPTVVEFSLPSFPTEKQLKGFLKGWPMKDARGVWEQVRIMPVGDFQKLLPILASPLELACKVGRPSQLETVARHILFDMSEKQRRVAYGVVEQRYKKLLRTSVTN